MTPLSDTVRSVQEEGALAVIESSWGVEGMRVFWWDGGPRDDLTIPVMTISKTDGDMLAELAGNTVVEVVVSVQGIFLDCGMKFDRDF